MLPILSCLKSYHLNIHKRRQKQREVIKRRTTQSDDLLHTSIPSALPCIKSIRLKQKDTETDTERQKHKTQRDRETEDDTETDIETETERSN